MKKLTLDTNGLIAVDTKELGHEAIFEILDLHNSRKIAVRTVATTAAESIHLRTKPFEEFLALLDRTGFGGCEILKPISKYGITFYGHTVLASPEDEILENKIWDVLFPGSSPEYPENGPLKAIKKWNNKMCDCQMLQSHIRYGGDVFITKDKNFLKQTKIGQLVDIGAGSINTPEGFITSIQ